MYARQSRKLFLLVKKEEVLTALTVRTTNRQAGIPHHSKEEREGRQRAELVIERLRVRIPAGAGSGFSSPEFILLSVLTLIRCPFNPVLKQWHVKAPGQSGQNVGGRLHVNTHTPLIQRSGSWLTLLCRRSVWEPIRETSSHATPQKHTATVVSAR